MGMEPVIALLMCIGIFVGARIWRRHHYGQPRDHAFESWCRQGPTLFAIRCADDGVEAALRLRRLVGASGEVFNFQGRNPWPHYRFEIAADRIEGGIVRVRAVSASLRAPKHRRSDVWPMLRELLADERARIAELWLHGQLYARDAHATHDRGKHGWIVRRAEDGELAISEMIGRPAWLASGVAESA